MNNLIKIDMEEKKYLTKKETSEYCTKLGLPISEKTLSKYICTGKGPEFSKFNRRVLYPIEGIKKWIDSKLSRTYTCSCQVVNHD